MCRKYTLFELEIIVDELKLLFGLLDPAVGDVDSSLQSCSEDGCIVATQSSSPTASSLIPVTETTLASKGDYSI